MKKIVVAIINLLAVVLCFDIKHIYNLCQFRDGAGIGIYIFSGLIEINDKVPYDNVPIYLVGLATVVLTVAIFDFFLIRKKFRQM